MMNLRNRTLEFLIALTAIVFVVMVIFNALGGAGYIGLFEKSVGQVSAKYSLYITPAGWTFGIWGFIYICLSATISYCVSTVFRTNASGCPVYVDPIILSPLFYALLTFNFVLNILWIFVWSNEYIVAATIFLLLITYSAWLAVGHSMLRARQALELNGNKLINKEIRLQRILIHNSVSLYATWTTIASLLNINAAFQYVGPYDAETMSNVSCGLLLVILVGWFVLENTIFDSYVRYTLTQYPVVILAAVGILDRQIRTPSAEIPLSVSILTWTLLGVSITFFISRLIIVSYRHRNQRSSTISRRSPSKNHGTFATE